MLLIIAAALLAFALSLILTPLCRDTSLRLGLVDHPDHGRKIHAHPISRIGGIPIFLAVIGSVAALMLLHSVLRLPGPDWGDVARLLPATSVILLVGLIDDLRGLRPWQKLAGQTVAAGLAYMGGVQIHTLAGLNVANAWWHLPLTLVWLVGCANAVNLIDGVDGLAAGIGLLATSTTLVAALLSHNTALALATAPLAGALLGFLRYNFNPATIFLGDCGSLSVGFLLGCYGVIWSQKSATLLGMTAPLIALCIPLLDTVLSIMRRFLRGKPIFGADRRHIHHRLLDLGLKPRRVVLVMYVAAGAAAACSLMISFSAPRAAGVVVVLFALGAWSAVQYLGYGEFSAASHIVFGGLLGRLIDTQLLLRQLDQQLAIARPMEESRRILATSSRKFGFNEIRIELGETSWRELFGTALRSECWQLRIPLRGDGYAEFSIPLNARHHPLLLSAFANLVRRRLSLPTARKILATEPGVDQVAATAEKPAEKVESA